MGNSRSYGRVKRQGRVWNCRSYCWPSSIGSYCSVGWNSISHTGGVILVGSSHIAVIWGQAVGHILQGR